MDIPITKEMDRMIALLAPTPLGAQIFGNPANADDIHRLTGI